MFQYKSTLSYDGTRYFGWQKTKSGPTIQEELEKAVIKIGETAPLPEAASRTDRGVHAESQIVALALQKSWDLATLQKALNNALPLDIRILKIESVPVDFHPTLEAIEKEYHYYCCLKSVQRPIHRRHSWHFYYPIDLEKMEREALDFLGTHDFSSLSNALKENPFCTIHRIKIIPLPEDRLQISIVGDRFLYKMARNIAGTLLYIGCGKIAPHQIPSILHSRDRKQAGVAAPAHALFLHRIKY
jgi:tRNA pseudouridine38-40 synthase